MDTAEHFDRVLHDDQAREDWELAFITKHCRSTHDRPTREGLRKLNRDVQVFADQVAMFPRLVSKLEAMAEVGPTAARFLGVDELLAEAYELQKRESV